MTVKEQLVIDVREPFEFSEGHFSCAINIPSGDFLDESVIDNLKKSYKNSAIVLYCRTGARSGRCQAILEGHGFTKVVNGINQKNIEEMENSDL